MGPTRQSRQGPPGIETRVCPVRAGARRCEDGDKCRPKPRPGRTSRRSPPAHPPHEGDGRDRCAGRRRYRPARGARGGIVAPAGVDPDRRPRRWCCVGAGGAGRAGRACLPAAWCRDRGPVRAPASFGGTTTVWLVSCRFRAGGQRTSGRCEPGRGVLYGASRSPGWRRGALACHPTGVAMRSSRRRARAASVVVAGILILRRLVRTQGPDRTTRGRSGRGGVGDRVRDQRALRARPRLLPARATTSRSRSVGVTSDRRPIRDSERPAAACRSRIAGRGRHRDGRQPECSRPPRRAGHGARRSGSAHPHLGSRNARPASSVAATSRPG